MSELLSVKNISVSYGASPVLRDVSVTIGTSEITGIVGESGSGKSTLIYALLGILPPGGRVDSGEALFDGRDLLTLPPEEMRKLRGKEMSLIAQNPPDSFHPIRKIRSQLKDLVQCHAGITYEEAEANMISIMEKISLKDCGLLLDSYAFELSGGMCQRVSIAMAMVMHPKLLLADEPTSALDVTSQKQVAEEMMKIRDSYGTSVLIVSHNMGVISYMSDRVVVMHEGSVVEYGPKEDVIRKPAHPYTVNLIDAVPVLGRPLPKGVRTYLQDRKGAGCPYRDICPRRTAVCAETAPWMQEVRSGHFVRCHNV